MSETKFTPGPWEVHGEVEHNISRTTSVYICRSDEPWPNGQLAMVNTADGFGSQVANANLIAAAPELYEALEAIAAMLGGYAGQPNLSGDIFKIADAALAKARGEQS